MGIEYRAARPSDFGELARLWGLFDGTTMTRVDSPAGFSGFLERNPGMSFVAVVSGSTAPGIRGIVGSVLGGHDGRRGYVYHLAVHPDFQGRGVGAELMERLESAMRGIGLEKAHLFVYPDNPAMGFYARMGWHLRDDLEVMSKVLDEGPGAVPDDGEGRSPA